MAAHRCARCGTSLMKSQAGRVKMRLSLVAFRTTADGTVVCETPCPGCGKDAELPITLACPDLRKSMQPAAPTPPPGVRLMVSLVPADSPLTPPDSSA